MPPQPRRHSKLAGKHPAAPDPAENRGEESSDTQGTGSSREDAGTRVRAYAREEAITRVPEDAGTQGPADASTRVRGDARTRVREDTGTSGPEDAGTQGHEDVSPHDQAERAGQQKFARDAAYGWAAATRRQAKRAQTWAAAIERAHAAGVPPALLREQIEEGAYQAGTSVDAIPHEVWRAAGLAGD